MSNRIQGSAAQAHHPIETDASEVEQTSSAASTHAASAAKAKEDGGPVDSIERSPERGAQEDSAGDSGHEAGPAVSAHSLQLTGGRSGHKVQDEARGKEAETGEEEKRIKEGDTSHDENEKAGPTGSSIRDRNWGSHGRTLHLRQGGKTYERAGRGVKSTPHPHPRSHEDHATSHRQPGGPKRDMSGKIWSSQDHHFEAIGVHVADGKHGHVALFEATGHFQAKAEVGEGKLKMGASGGVAAYLVNAEGHGTYKNGSTELTGSAYLNVGAHADGNVSVAFDPLHGTVGGKIGIDAFAGVTAGLNGSAKAAGVEVGGEARVEAGIGFEANGTAEFEKGKLELKGDLGACIGVGADLKFNVEIDGKEVLEHLDHANDYLGAKQQEVMKFAEKKTGEVADAALGVAADEVGKAASGLASFLDKAASVAHTVETGAELIREVVGK